MVWRPFYFAKSHCRSKDENKLFKVDLGLIYSTNGGRSFSRARAAHTAISHDVWISPANSNIVYATDDGGSGASEDGGTLWKHQVNLPGFAVLPRRASTNRIRTRYGGLQDNSRGSVTHRIQRGQQLAVGEHLRRAMVFWVFEDPSDPTTFYAEAQGGTIGRVNRHTLENRFIQPQPLYGEKKLHFNWNTPIHVSPNEKGTIYIGAQFLFRSRDHGNPGTASQRT